MPAHNLNFQNLAAIDGVKNLTVFDTSKHPYIGVELMWGSNIIHVLRKL
jgi:hypothetical protein